VSIIAQRIEQEIPQLSLEEMLVLHDMLLTSIGEKEEAQNLDPDDVDEIQRRIREIDSGTITGTDAFQSLREM